MTARVHRTKIVIMAGLPGTGKTALATVLAQRLDGIVLSKEEVRAALFPPGAITYSSGQNDFCMSLILMAAQRIAADHTVPFIFTRRKDIFAHAAHCAGRSGRGHGGSRAQDSLSILS